MNSPSSILDPGRPVARGRRRPPPLADSILGAIGNTPLAELRQIVRLLQGPERGRRVAIIVCDSGLKYLSTDLYP
jgi:hypothetical protein